MNIPPWILFVVAAWVLLFGAYRIHIALKKERRSSSEGGPGFRRTGMLGGSRRGHLLFGALYLFLGVYLLALGLGAGIVPSGCAAQDGAAESGLPPG